MVGIGNSTSEDKEHLGTIDMKPKEPLVKNYYILYFFFFLGHDTQFHRNNLSNHCCVQIHAHGPRNQNHWMEFRPLFEAGLKYPNGSNGNIDPFVFLPNIWSFREPPETVNQKRCLHGE